MVYADYRTWEIEMSKSTLSVYVEILSVALFTAARALPARAAVTATDNASNAPYSDGWQSGDNGGTGWGGVWALTVSGTISQSGHFVYDSTKNADGARAGPPPADGNTTTAGPAAWGMYANSGQSARAARPFSGALDVGQGFS